MKNSEKEISKKILKKFQKELENNFRISEKQIIKILEKGYHNM